MSLILQVQKTAKGLTLAHLNQAPCCADGNRSQLSDLTMTWHICAVFSGDWEDRFQCLCWWKNGHKQKHRSRNATYLSRHDHAITLHHEWLLCRHKAAKQNICAEYQISMSKWTVRTRGLLMYVWLASVFKLKFTGAMHLVYKVTSTYIRTERTMYVGKNMCLHVQTCEW